MFSPPSLPTWEFEDPAKAPLDPRVKIEWFVAPLLGFLTLFGIDVVFSLATAAGGISGRGTVVFAAILAVIAAFSGVWVQLAYRNYWYAPLPDVLVVGRGVLFKTRTYIPYGRIQNVNVTRTLLDRLLGLSRVTVDTAGARFSEAVIPGIAQPDGLVALVMARAEEHRFGRARGISSEDADARAFDAIRANLAEVLRLARGEGEVPRGVGSP